MVIIISIFTICKETYELTMRGYLKYTLNEYLDYIKNNSVRVNWFIFE